MAKSDVTKAVLALVFWVLANPALGAQADGAISETVSPASPRPGDTVTFTATIINIGPDALDKVQLAESNTSLLAFGLPVQVTTSQGTCSKIPSPVGGEILCELGSLDAGKSITLTFSMVVGTAQVGSAIGHVLSLGTDAGVDSHRENNVVSTFVRILGTEEPPPPPPPPEGEGCPEPTVAPSAPFVFRGYMWSAQMEFSQTEGLVASQIKLGTRLMATRASLPYFIVQTSRLAARGNLTPNSSVSVARTRLVGFRQTSDSMKVTLEATYAVDRIPRTSKSCLRIKQRYELHRTFFPGMKRVGFDDPCEASHKAPFSRGQFNCARFIPSVEYSFSGEGNETLTRVEFPQRVFLTIDGKSPNAGLFILDSDNDIPLPPFATSPNPLPSETRSVVIQAGTKGEWDNYHQTFEDKVDLPFPRPPGCPECAHVHWRWGEFLAFPDNHDPGIPLIPAGSLQTVEVAIVKYRAIEDTTSAVWQDLENGESLAGADLAFWHVGEGIQPSDSFFDHGLFFGPPIHLSLINMHPEPSINGFQMKIRFTNTTNDDVPGPISLVLDDINARVLNLPVTQVVPPLGSPYLNLIPESKRGNVLPAGAFVDVPLNVSDAQMDGFHFNARVLTGPGPR